VHLHQRGRRERSGHVLLDQGGALRRRRRARRRAPEGRSSCCDQHELPSALASRAIFIATSGASSPSWGACP
jgi:hypothetical protein